MVDEELGEVFKLAKEKIEEFDTIIDLFDMTFVYNSMESAMVSRYTPKEMIGKSISDFMTIQHDELSFSDTIMKSMIGGILEVPVKTKNGKE